MNRLEEILRARSRSFRARAKQLKAWWLLKKKYERIRIAATIFRVFSLAFFVLAILVTVWWVMAVEIPEPNLVENLAFLLLILYIFGAPFGVHLMLRNMAAELEMEALKAEIEELRQMVTEKG